jgi:cytidine deaminase
MKAQSSMAHQLAARDRLIHVARAAATHAYCPYSRFRVGAATLVDGELFTGCNIENASFGLTLCAERVALFKAISDGKGRRVQVLAVSCPDLPPHAAPENRMSCGACLQVLAEFSTPDTVLIVDGVGDFLLSDLLRLPFSLSSK